MSTLWTYSVCRRLATVSGLRSVRGTFSSLEGELKLKCNLSSFTVLTQKVEPVKIKKPPLPTGPEGQTAPEDFDGGDYDEQKNEEYEQEAQRREQKIRRIKKILSSAMFVSVLGYVGYSRRGQRSELAKNIENVKFITDDGLFQGSERMFYLYSDPERGGAKVVLPASMVKDGTIRKIRNFHVREGDIFVASFPKAGTTWVQEIVYLINNDLNFDEAKKQVLETRFPFLEYPFPGLSTIEKMESPRLIKTHLPFEFLPEEASTAKIIYVTRNPKDTVVSYFHFSRMFTMSNFVGSFDDFLLKFEKDELPYCPFFNHVESYAKQKENPDVLIVSYEELSQDPAEVIQKIASFLGKTLSAEDTRRLVEHTRFDNMARNASVNYEHWDDIGFRNKKEAKFMRKGKVGDWRNYLSKEENQRFDDWAIAANKIQYPFVYDEQ